MVRGWQVCVCVCIYLDLVSIAAFLNEKLRYNHEYMSKELMQIILHDCKVTMQGMVYISLVIVMLTKLLSETFLRKHG